MKIKSHQTRKTIKDIKVRCEDFLENIGDGVITTDQSGRIIFANRSAERMLGCKTSEMIGKSLIEACGVFDENGDRLFEKDSPILQVIKKKTTFQGSSYYLMRKNGNKFPVNLTISPVIAKNKLIGIIDTFQDITKDREIERLRLDFLMLASHQLRTPLSGIKWMIETMQRGSTGDLNQKQNDYLSRIYNVNERMIRIISEMFSVLNLESGTVFVKKDKVSVDKICKEIIILMNPVAKEDGVLLQNNIKISTVIETDPQILSAIINYLISNAIDYSFASNKVIISAKDLRKDIIISVEDSGIGIPVDEQNKIFEKFYRASNARIFKPNGTGLGLNIAKSFAEKLGGDIYFKSKENKGSTFYLRIPKKSNYIKQTKYLNKK